MEFVISNKNHEEINRIIIGIIESYFKTNVEYSSFYRIGTDTQLITVDIEDEITDRERSEIMKIIEKIDYCCKFLYKGFELPIKQLKSMNHKYHKIINYKDVYYYNPNDINEELMDFAHVFTDHFTVKYHHVDIESQLVKNTLIIDKYGLISCKIEDSNGRLYLKIDNEKHHFGYKELSNFISNRMEDSNLETYYKLDSMDKLNIKRLQDGKSPLSSYYPTQNTTEHVFRLVMSFTKICKKENLPMFNLKDIVNFSQDILGFEYYTINNVIKIKEAYENLDITNYREHEFDYLENALAFSIYLSGFGIKHFMLSNQTLHKYTICYIYGELLEPYVNIDDMKQRVIEYYKNQYGVNKDMISDKKFKHMSIQELLSCVDVRQTLIFDKSIIQHINPFDNKPLPLYYYEVKNHQKYGIYNIGNIVKGIFRRIPLYNREHLKLRNVSIEIDDGSVIIHGIKITDEMFFTDNQRALKHINRIWQKGYFLNSFGLMYYIETGDFIKQTIILPEWFTMKNSSEGDFYKFLKFNDL